MAIACIKGPWLGWRQSVGEPWFPMGPSKILGGCDVRSQEFVPVQSCHISCQLAMSQSESAYSAIADWHWTTSKTSEVAIRAPYGDMGTSQRRNGDVRTWWHVGKIGPWLPKLTSLVIQRADCQMHGLPKRNATWTCTIGELTEIMSSAQPWRATAGTKRTVAAALPPTLYDQLIRAGVFLRMLPVSARLLHAGWRLSVTSHTRTRTPSAFCTAVSRAGRPPSCRDFLDAHCRCRCAAGSRVRWAQSSVRATRDRWWTRDQQITVAGIHQYLR